MINKKLFCSVVEAIREQFQLISNLESTLDTSLEAWWKPGTSVLESLEDSCGFKWADDIWEDILSATSPVECIYDYLEDESSTKGGHKTPNTVKDLIDDMFSHNTIISLNVEKQEDNGVKYLERIWRGEAWKLEEEHPEYLDYKFIRFHNVVPESITKTSLFIEVSQG